MPIPNATPRRAFLHTVGWVGLAAASPVAGLEVAGDRRGDVSARDFPRNDLERVQTVVGASHFNLDVVRELVTEQPALAKASWDWGFGDWESALGAASHTGRREIAELLIAHGARPNVFTAAMMGNLAAVEAFLRADLGLHRLDGPHGISLLQHARSGGSDAQAVVDHLLERFGPDVAPPPFAGDEAVEARYGGRYVFPGDPPATLSVGVGGGFLLVGAGDRPTSRVRLVEGDVFHPAGAPAVRLRFEVVDGRAAGLTVSDGPRVVVGSRAGA